MKMKTAQPLFILFLIIFLSACGGGTAAEATPTVDPDIYNQVPDTTVFDPGQCTAVLDTPAPAFTSNTLGGESSGEIPAGQYEVGVAADYGSSLWFALNGVEGPNYINSTSASSLVGDCSTGS